MMENGVCKSTISYNSLFLKLNLTISIVHRGFPGGTSGKEPACQCRGLKRHELDPWVKDNMPSELIGHNNI